MKMVMYWAFDCNHYNVRETCKFFVFPKDPKEYKRWTKLLRRVDKPGRGARVCSCHFREGKRENGPEIFVRNTEKLFRPHHLTPEKKTRKHKHKDFTLLNESSTPTTGLGHLLNKPTSTVSETETYSETSGISDDDISIASPSKLSQSSMSSDL